MSVYEEYIDFDFETGEIVEPVQYDMIDFMARIPGKWGVATINSWAKIPSGVLMTHKVKPLKKDFIFDATFYPRTRRKWNGTQPPYVHESL